jgi:hypothetical protein
MELRYDYNDGTYSSYIINLVNSNKFNYASSSYLELHMNKNRHPTIYFPSTNCKKYYEHEFHIRETFKMNNRVFLNFCEIYKDYTSFINNDENSEIYRYIYINFNNDKKNIDINNITNLINYIFQNLV